MAIRADPHSEKLPVGPITGCCALQVCHQHQRVGIHGQVKRLVGLALAIGKLVGWPDAQAAGSDCLRWPVRWCRRLRGNGTGQLPAIRLLETAVGDQLEALFARRVKVGESSQGRFGRCGGGGLLLNQGCDCRCGFGAFGKKAGIARIPECRHNQQGKENLRNSEGDWLRARRRIGFGLAVRVVID